jgi:tetratricopeptide (TPR) repeat protein
MTIMTISEREGIASTPNADLILDHGEKYPITITDPFTEKEEERLEWYFERHVRFPFTRQVRAERAAASITGYGEALFEQVFADRRAYARYQEALQAGLETLAFEVAGSPDFHRLHWEALKDPDLPQPLALQALMVRRNLVPQAVRAGVRSSPTINLLIVTARPGGVRDVGYRTISRPLVGALQQAGLRVQVDIVRPGTYKALVRHLEAVQDRRGTGHYHVVHFDVHGALRTYPELDEAFKTDRFLYQARYGRDDIQPYEGRKAFLFLEGEKEGQADPVEAGELADLLLAHQVPVAILNACQSGKQVGDTETSLGSRLMAAGVQMVLAMGYSVTVSAAELMMRTLYQELFAGRDLPAAIRRARLELHNRKGRRAYFNQTLDLEDWLLPVVYQNREQILDVREFKPEERAAYYERQARRYRPPETAYGFVGRDLDLLQIERRLLAKGNLLLLRGMGGAGKTTLLHHLGAWWQTTGFVNQVFYFGYDERAWTRQQILHQIGRGLMDDAEFLASFQPLSPDAQQEMLAERLCAGRHLLVLDNLESITGSHLAIRNTLPEDERRRLQGFLSRLAGGKTVVLLGSRGGEPWLAPGTFGDNVYELPGLDPEAASTLADRVLVRHGATGYRQDPDLGQLLKLLDGYPLPIEVVLANLARQTPAGVLAALQAGDVALDKGDAQSKTESILRCIDYSHSNLSPQAQGLLACLAPFTGVVYTGALEQYTAQLKGQPALAGLPFERWPEVLQEAANWGLLSPHPEMHEFLRLQPTLPYFLRSRLAAEGRAEVRKAIETAFHRHYDGVAGAMIGLLLSKDAQEKQLGQVLVGLEYENILSALEFCLQAQASIYNTYGCLTNYVDMSRNHQLGLALGQRVLERSRGLSAEELPESFGVELARVMGDTGTRHLMLKRYSDAGAAYHQCLSLIGKLDTVDPKVRGEVVGTTYHQLGRVAQEQRQWAQAERYYQQALEIQIEFNARYEQAATYHQLGSVAQEQRQWAQAERYYQQALEIKIEFNARYEQAATYHQLGRVAQEQRQWAQARDYLLKDLEISAEFGDEHGLGITLRSLARLWQASGDAELPAAMASILGVTPEEAAALLRQASAGPEGQRTTEEE